MTVPFSSRLTAPMVAAGGFCHHAGTVVELDVPEVTPYCRCAICTAYSAAPFDTTSVI